MLIITLSKSLSKMELVIMLCISVAVELVTLVGLFIVAIMLNSNVTLTKFWTFFLDLQ